MIRSGNVRRFQTLSKFLFWIDDPMLPTQPEFRKLQLLSENAFPTQSEVCQYLGSSLAEVVFEYSHYDTQKLLGLTPPLKGTEREFWISPENQLTNNMALTVANEDNIVKECTHRGILAIGEVLLEKFQKGIEQKMQKVLKQEFNVEIQLLQAERRKALEIDSQEICERYKNYIKNLYKFFEESLQAEIAKTITKCNKRTQIAVVQERIRVTEEMMRKMRREASYIVTSLHDDFVQKHYSTKEKIIADFNEITRKERVKMLDATREIERQKKEALRAQQHQLRLQNLADVIYVLCVERARSSSAKRDARTNFQGKIRNLEGLVIEQNKIMDKMRNDIVQHCADKTLLKDTLCRVAKEFQKFICFVLHAAPGQSEFLLDGPCSTQKINNNQESFKLNEVDALNANNHNNNVAEMIRKDTQKVKSVNVSTNGSRLDRLVEPVLAETKLKVHDSCSCESCAAAYSKMSVKSLNRYNSVPFCSIESGSYVSSDTKNRPRR